MLIIKALSVQSFELDYLKKEIQEDPTACFISILNPDEVDVKPFFEDDENHLTLSFYDVPYNIRDSITKKVIYPSISYEQAEQIVDFIKSNSFKEKFYVHCSAGISRSGAVCEFIFDLYGKINEFDFEDYQKMNPNTYRNLYVKSLLHKVHFEKYILFEQNEF